MGSSAARAALLSMMKTRMRLVKMWWLMSLWQPTRILWGKPLHGHSPRWGQCLLHAGATLGVRKRTAVLPVPPPGQPMPPDCEPLESRRRQTPRANSATALRGGSPETSFIKSLKVGTIVLLQMEKLRLMHLKFLKVMQLGRIEGDFQSSRMGGGLLL